MARCSHRLSALFVQGIANAAENTQTNNTLLTNGPAQVNAREAAVFHGLLIGLGGNWRITWPA